MRTIAFAISFLSSLAATALAQGFNVDIGVQNPPPATYFAATGQAGFWNVVSPTATGAPLNDLANNATGVTITCSPPGTVIEYGGSPFNPTEAFLSDAQDLGQGPGAISTWTMFGLANGNYRVTIYSTQLGPTGTGTTEATVVGGALGAQTCSEPYPGYSDYGYSRSFVHDTTSVTNGTLSWTVRAVTGSGKFNGMQLEPIVPGEIRAYCVAIADSQGCVPSIYATGSASLSSNSLRVKATNVMNNELGVMFWGGAPLSNWNSGIRCVAPPYTRTLPQMSNGNPPPVDCSGTYSFHWNMAYSAKAGLAPGDTVWCQYWARDPLSFHMSSLTNGLRITFAP